MCFKGMISDRLQQTRARLRKFSNGEIQYMVSIASSEISIVVVDLSWISSFVSPAQRFYVVFTMFRISSSSDI
jgi:hypothetical protein